SVCLFSEGCERGTPSQLKGQTNTTMTFYGRAVDQDGRPLPGVSFKFTVDAYPKDWSFRTRGRPNDVKTVTAVSDARGSFQLQITGCYLRMISAERSG